MKNKDDNDEEIENHQKNIGSEIIKEELQRMRKNIIPALFAALIAVLACIVGCTYFIKSIIYSNSLSLIESAQLLFTSLWPALGIGFCGFVIFITCLFIEEN